MRTGLSFAGAILLIAAGLASACGGGPEGDVSGEPTAAGTAPPSPTADGVQATPTEFEALRDSLWERLDAIGVNIVAIPSDVREDLLASCRELESFVARERVDEICGAIEQAIERGDPGLIDLVLDELAEMEPG